MDSRSGIYLIAVYAHIAPVVPYDNLIPKTSPFLRRVKDLVQISIVSERLCTDYPAKFQILEPFFIVRNPNQL